MPAIELHGNLSQNARTRNLAAFSTGTATTLVATDIAARGIHVDDVGLVVHADPPVEHKAYLHRSGRTARAGNEGTVVTLMLDSQVSDVRDLARKAGIKPTITRLGTGHPLLEQIAPGERTFVAASAMPSAPRPTSPTAVAAPVAAVAATAAAAPAAPARGRSTAATPPPRPSPRRQRRGEAAPPAPRRSRIRWPPAQRRVVLQLSPVALSRIVPNGRQVPEAREPVRCSGLSVPAPT